MQKNIYKHRKRKKPEHLGAVIGELNTVLYADIHQHDLHINQNVKCINHKPHALFINMCSKAGNDEMMTDL